MVPADATTEVPLIIDLNLTAEEWEKKPKRRDEAAAETHTYRRAWKEYLQRVPPASFRQTRNFMMAVIAEGRSFDRDDTLADTAAKGPPVLCTLSSGDIDEVLSGQRVQELKPEQTEVADTASSKNLVRSMRAAINTASRVMSTQKTQHGNSRRETASKHEKKMTDFASDRKEKGRSIP